MPITTTTTTTNQLDITDIDFENIKENLKDFLKSDPNFTDYDFEGSALSSLVNILAYVTHINAINANIGLNETFLNSAQFRGSVTGHAQMLGYTPKSVSAPAAFLKVTLTSGFDPSLSYVIPKGFKFNTSINGKSFSFVTTTDYTAINGVFESVRVLEGKYKTAEFLYDVRGQQKFLIPDSNVDTSTLRVNVKPFENSPDIQVFTLVKNITRLGSDSNVFFLSENAEGLFEVSFGDGIIGKALQDGNLISVEYVVTNKDEANSARIFSLSDSINGASASIETLSPARGGEEKESINRIKRNAPITFASQNRGVTPQDYEAIILSEGRNVKSVKVWGGEDEDPPVFGTVNVSIQPLNTDFLSTSEKEEIINSILTPKSMVSITPKLIDPEILGITFEVFFKYDPSQTSLTQTELENKVRKTIQRYGSENHDRFDTVFRYSNFLKAIDNTDISILNSFARIYLQKRFIPLLNVPTTYELEFSVPLYRGGSDIRNVIFNSSLFTFEGIRNCRFKDFPLEFTRDERIVSIVRTVGTSEQIIRRNIGTVQNNKIILFNFAPDSFAGSDILLEVIPNSYDISAARNTILRVDCGCERFQVIGEIDELVSGRDPSGINYRTAQKYAER